MDRSKPTILVIRLSALGDLIELSKTVNMLRGYWPRARIELLTGPLGIEIYSGTPMFATTHCWPHRALVRNFSAFCSLVKTLRKTHYDLVIDMHCKRITGCIALMLRKARILRSSTGPLRRTFLGKERSKPRNIAELLIAAGEPADRISAAYSRHFKAGFPTPPDARRRWQANLEKFGWQRDRSTIALCPGSSPGWPSKRWPADYFRELAASLVRQGWQIVLLGTKEEQSTARLIQRGVEGIYDLTGDTDLQGLAAVLSFASVAICNDSGPLHMAAASGVRTIALFGPTAANRYGPHILYGPEHRSLYAGIECAPCYKGHCPLPARKCMEAILTTEVLQAVFDAVSVTVGTEISVK